MKNYLEHKIYCMKTLWCYDCDRNTTFNYTKFSFYNKPVYLKWCSQCKNKSPHLISKL